MKRFFVLFGCFMLTILGTGSACRTEPAVDPARPMVALTFDDGPYSPATNRVLDALEAVDGRATFFVVGNRVAGCASVLRRADALGCQIGNHTWDHTDLTTLSAADILSQLERCDAAVEEVLGKRPALIRPVGGCVSTTVYDAVERPMILWSVDPRDWATEDVDQVCRTVLDDVQDGDVILLHDLYLSTAQAAERIIPALVERGFQLVTVEELARCKSCTLTGHTTYTRF